MLPIKIFLNCELQLITKDMFTTLIEVMVAIPVVGQFRADIISNNERLRSQIQVLLSDKSSCYTLFNCRVCVMTATLGCLLIEQERTPGRLATQVSLLMEMGRLLFEV